MTDFLDDITWNEDGLLPAVAQDAITGRILMVAWMNREALSLTAKEQRAVYWSRSRKKLWRKGEESGHVQHVKEIRLDCDSDVIVLNIEQVGGIACHTGRECIKKINGSIGSSQTSLTRRFLCFQPSPQRIEQNS